MRRDIFYCFIISNSCELIMIKYLRGFLLSDVKTDHRIAFVQLKSEAIIRGKHVLMELSALTWNSET